MITVRVSGGLGNQLFQYAFGKTLAVKQGVQLALDLSYYKKIPESDTPRKFELSNFAVKYLDINIKNLIKYKICSNKIISRFPEIQNFLGFYKEKEFNYTQFAVCLPDGIYAEGFWQSYKYFKSELINLKKELIPIIQMSEEDFEISKKISACRSVSVHVRRGDYVSHPNAARHHGICGINYYKSAIEHLKSKIDKNLTYFIFSDDIDWVKQHFKFEINAIYISHNINKSSVNDFRLMQLCENHIIANSTFSWWGAYLKKPDQGVVIAPKNWFADNKKTPDLIPCEWIKI